MTLVEIIEALEAALPRHFRQKQFVQPEHPALDWLRKIRNERKKQVRNHYVMDWDE